MQRLAELVIFAGRRREGPQTPPRIWRRLFHLIAGSSIPLAGIFAPELEFVLALTVLAAGSVVLELSRFGIGPLNRVYMRWMAPLLKEEETSRMTGATHMLVASAVVFWLFGKEVGVPVMFYLSLGDPVAAIVGRRLPGPRLAGKSPGGTAGIRRRRFGGCRGAGLLRGRRLPLGPVGRGRDCSRSRTGGNPARRQSRHPADCRNCNVGHGPVTWRE